MTPTQRRPLGHAIRSTLAATLTAALLCTATPVVAGGSVDGEPAWGLVVELHRGEIISLREPATAVYVANPEIADVQVPPPGTVLINGKKPGRTTLIAMSGDRVIIETDITVRHDITMLKAQLDRAGLGGIEPRSVPGHIVLGGSITSPEQANRAVRVAEGFIGPSESVRNEILLTSSAQVNLRVRVAEVSRRALRNLGINWDAVAAPGNFVFGLATGREPTNELGQFLRSPLGDGNYAGRFSSGRVNIDSLIDALAEENLITMLAEPNLTAMSGQQAQFLAGGEFPIPINAGDNQITVEFRQFGVSLNFLPTVMSESRIAIKVKPEVSELSDIGAVDINGVRIPGLSVRRAETTVELGSGESFAIAGLIQNHTSTTVSGLPGAGDVPVLGQLFRSNKFQRDETELVIIVTPFVVKPVSDPKQMASPTDGMTQTRELQRLISGRLATTPADLPPLSSRPGFVLE